MAAAACTIVAALALVACAGPAQGESWKVVDEARAGSMPWSVTVSPDGATLWIAMVGLKNRDNVWRFDAASLEAGETSRYRGHAVEAALTAHACW
jgi:hypothetical protein